MWAETAYRLKANEALIGTQGVVLRVHRKKPDPKAMPRHIPRSNFGKSVIWSHVEHVFAGQKSQTSLFVQAAGIAQTTMRIGLANIRLQHAPLSIPQESKLRSVAGQSQCIPLCNRRSSKINFRNQQSTR